MKNLITILNKKTQNEMMLCSWIADQCFKNNGLEDTNIVAIKERGAGLVSAITRIDKFSDYCFRVGIKNIEPNVREYEAIFIDLENGQSYEMDVI